jgi:hypothetical protein
MGGDMWEGRKRNKEYKRVIDVSFKRWKSINIILFLSQGFRCKLDQVLPNELCQTVRDELLFYLTYVFLEVGKNTRFTW